MVGPISSRPSSAAHSLVGFRLARCVTDAARPVQSDHPFADAVFSCTFIHAFSSCRRLAPLVPVENRSSRIRRGTVGMVPWSLNVSRVIQLIVSAFLHYLIVMQPLGVTVAFDHWIGPTKVVGCAHKRGCDTMMQTLLCCLGFGLVGRVAIRTNQPTDQLAPRLEAWKCRSSDNVADRILKSEVLAQTSGGWRSGDAGKSAPSYRRRALHGGQSLV